MNKENRTANRRLAKKRVLCLNEALCFELNSVLADSFRLRNRQLLVAAKRYASYLKKKNYNNLLKISS